MLHLNPPEYNTGLKRVHSLSWTNALWLNKTKNYISNVPIPKNHTTTCCEFLRDGYSFAKTKSWCDNWGNA